MGNETSPRGREPYRLDHLHRHRHGLVDPRNLGRGRELNAHVAHASQVGRLVRGIALHGDCERHIHR